MKEKGKQSKAKQSKEAGYLLFPDQRITQSTNYCSEAALGEERGICFSLVLAA